MTTRETVGEVFCDAIAAGELRAMTWAPSLAPDDNRRMWADFAAEDIVRDIARAVYWAGSVEDFLRIIQEKTAKLSEK